MAFNFFCPTCANLLLGEITDVPFDCKICSVHSSQSYMSLHVAVDVDSGQPLFKCQTCPYVYSVDREVSSKSSGIQLLAPST